MKPMIIDGYTCPCCSQHTSYEGRCSWCVNQYKGDKHTSRK